MAKSKRISAKKLVKKTKKVKEIKQVVKYLPITEEEHLEHLIAVSMSNVTSQGTSIDEFFEQQANRLRKELEELRKSNEK